MLQYPWMCEVPAAVVGLSKRIDKARTLLWNRFLNGIVLRTLILGKDQGDESSCWDGSATWFWQAQ